MNVRLSLLAAFVALQAGALTICVLMMVAEQGPVGFLEGFGVWIFAQAFVLPIFLVAALPLLIVRYFLGKLSLDAKIVSCFVGAVVGSAGAGIIAASSTYSNFETVMIAAIRGGVGGLVAGWAWWRVEKHWLQVEQQ